VSGLDAADGVGNSVLDGVAMAEAVDGAWRLGLWALHAHTAKARPIAITSRPWWPIHMANARGP
jgi:hypothetical protein